MDIERCSHNWLNVVRYSNVVDLFGNFLVTLFACLRVSDVIGDCVIFNLKFV